MITLADDLHTIRDWLRWAVSRFNEAQLSFGHGCANAYDEAAWLILHTLHLPLGELESFLDARLARDERLAVLEILQQRIAKRVPAAYLTHEAWLGEYKFYVDERVIVPRSFFAELLENGFAPWIEDADAVADALDLCTGSGCLAIIMADTLPNAHVDAVDLSPDALAVARRNIADYGLEDVVTPIESDLFAKLDGRQYDLIISNPPYVTTASMDALPPEYRHEPSMALAAGADGLDIVRRILAEAKAHLKPGGVLAVEVGHNRDLVEAAFPELEAIWLDAEGGDEKIFLLTREQL
ncbi:MAG TPA: 50S ribosomal protein L3 N(5)-glutamine methyltransferase [Rhodocyclaceae bacterium]|nr:50S ribosomal protein L3 N(5)-glutamine methyltransferase [Rhodocyclaceae bacterium]